MKNYQDALYEMLCRGETLVWNPWRRKRDLSDHAKLLREAMLKVILTDTKEPTHFRGISDRIEWIKR